MGRIGKWKRRAHEPGNTPSNPIVSIDSKRYITSHEEGLSLSTMVKKYKRVASLTDDLRKELAVAGSVPRRIS